MNEGEKKFDLEELIFRYKFWIGGFLLLLIIIGGGALVWRENYWKPALVDRSYKQDVRIRELELKLAEDGRGKVEGVSEKSELRILDSKTNSNTQSMEVANNTAVSSNAQKSNETIPKTSNTTTKSAVIGKVNINNATETQFDALPGIGPIYAKRIVEYRESKGGFSSVNDLKNVKGIGEKTFEKFKDLIIVE